MEKWSGILLLVFSTNFQLLPTAFDTVILPLRRHSRVLQVSTGPCVKLKGDLFKK